MMAPCLPPRASCSPSQVGRINLSRGWLQGRYSRLGRLVNELPVRVRVARFNDTKGFCGRSASNAHDAAARRRYQLPFGLARYRVRVNAAQVALCGQETVVFEEVLQLFGVTLHGAGGALIVEADRLRELVPDPEKLGFLFAL